MRGNFANNLNFAFNRGVAAGQRHFYAGQGLGAGSKASQFGASIMGRAIPGGLYRGIGLGLAGIYTARKIGQSYDRLRNGHVMGSLLAAGMAGSVAYGVYKSNFLKNVTRQHLATGIGMMGAMRAGIRSGLRNL